jgi:hypothetical protein
MARIARKKTVECTRWIKGYLMLREARQIFLSV